RVFFFCGDLVRALPLEADPPDTDAVAQRHAAGLDKIEPPLRRVDDDGARRILGVVMHGGAAEVGAVKAKDVVAALLRRAAAQHVRVLVVGLGLRDAGMTGQGGDGNQGGNTTCQHRFYPSKWKWCGPATIEPTVSPARRQLSRPQHAGSIWSPRRRD